MAYDDVIRIDILQSLLTASARQQAPVELLTLSACETAEGDDRAPLGLSGVALHARAHSTLGTPLADQRRDRLCLDNRLLPLSKSAGCRQRKRSAAPS